LWPNIRFLSSILTYICICTFFVTFFSATIDGRNLIFGHKLHIGTPYHGKWQGYHKWALYHSSPCFKQTGSRNLMVPKTLPTIWHTYVKLVTKYQIPAINSCWEKCDEKYLFNFNFMFFFLKNYFYFESWRKKIGWTGEKNIFRLDIFTV
jgi:hypothetical protein